MTLSNIKYVILFLVFCSITWSCVTLQQPLPGSLLGDWAFVKTGTITENGSEQLFNYNHICSKESDRLSFRSDKKLSLCWYDESCMINYYFIGKYHVEGTILKVDLADSNPHQDSPFLPITKYRINQTSHNTLKLEEILDENRSRQRRGNRNQEPMVFIFMRID